MSGRYTQVLPLLLAAALGLTPQFAQAFAFASAIESRFVLPNQTTGDPIIWILPQVTMSVRLESLPPGTMLANGTTNWDTNVAEALALWNTVVPIADFVQREPTEGARPTDRMEIRFAYDDVALYVGALWFVHYRPSSASHIALGPLAVVLILVTPLAGLAAIPLIAALLSLGVRMNCAHQFTLRREGNLRDAREPGILTFIFQSGFARRDD